MQFLMRMGKTSIQAACWAACLDAVISCWITSVLSVFVTASWLLQEPLNGVCTSRSCGRSTPCNLLSPPTEALLPGYGFCYSQCGVSNVPQLIWGGRYLSSLAQKAALVPDSDVWGRPKAQWLVFSFLSQEKDFCGVSLCCQIEHHVPALFLKLLSDLIFASLTRDPKCRTAKGIFPNTWQKDC